jgi:hypothetical protein
LRRAHEDVPAGQAWPAGQTSQEVEPKGFAKVPAAQGEHDGALKVALKEPGRHKKQLREVKLAKVPGEQEKG